MLRGRKIMSLRTEKLLHRALSRWRDWQTGDVQISELPKVLEQLQGGMTNESFMVQSGDFRAVVRVNALNAQALGIDRKKEQSLLAYLQTTGCVPKLVFSDSDTQVTQLISGRHLSQLDLADEDIQEGLESCIERIQAVRVDMPVRNYSSYISLYSDQLSHFDGLAEIERAANIIDELQWAPVVTHHDLILENIIINDQGLHFLDWEYADLGHPGIDRIKLFGRTYCEDRDGSSGIDALETLQNGIVKLWYAVQDAQLTDGKRTGNI